MRTNFADERLSSVERMKAAHVAACAGCFLCRPADFEAPAAPDTTSMIVDVQERVEAARVARVNNALEGVDEALAFLSSYTGKWEFMLTLKAEHERGHLRPTPRVVEVILNCKRREATWAAERAAVEATPATVVPMLPEGRRFYAVENDEGTLTFLRITTTKPSERFPNPTTFVDQVVGGGADEDQSSTPRGRVTNGHYRGTMEALYLKVVADPEAAMVRFGLAIGKCGYCGRVLTDPESRALGIGPVCRAKAF